MPFSPIERRGYRADRFDAPPLSRSGFLELMRESNVVDDGIIRHRVATFNIADLYRERPSDVP
jgi:hypothetical protein